MFSIDQNKASQGNSRMNYQECGAFSVSTDLHLYLEKLKGSILQFTWNILNMKDFVRC